MLVLGVKLMEINSNGCFPGTSNNQRKFWFRFTGFKPSKNEHKKKERRKKAGKVKMRRVNKGHCGVFQYKNGSWEREK